MPRLQAKSVARRRPRDGAGRDGDRRPRRPDRGV